MTNKDSIYTYKGGIAVACPTSDGGYLLEGKFDTYNGNKRGNIIKTDANGTVDTNYFQGVGFNDSTNIYYEGVYAIEPGQLADVYYIGGNFTYFNGHPVDPIIRLKKSTIGNPPIPNKPMVFALYPNPANNYTVIKLPPKININQTTIKIYNILGMLVQKIQPRATTCTIHTSALQAGVYFVSVNSKEKIFQAKKLIIH